ncbi:MAG: 3-oxoadipate enol-lactonase [Alphaproteobacteria bacterium]|jgi:3-oxoadipate enol-lactonase|nr:3-oxoadipate enol-lactonase [Alphaproteobacteria bacterium]MDP6516958.1 3-oxoadipate enol-lactonase [Alphaproteobacteria bacterium]|tara:strand:- start:452 stop:1240 length:789 start_codon:yes stop_codon:yes gene_type:complete
MRITANGVGIGYRLDGPEDAPVVCLSNSLASNMTMWAPQVAALAADYRVLRYDTRGHGTSEAVPGPYSIAMLAEDLLALFSELGIARAHFVGLSLGGMIGQWLAAHHGEVLASAALCSTTSRVPPEMAPAWDERVATAEGAGMAALVEPTIERWFSPAFVAAEPGAVDPVRAMIRDTSIAGYAGCIGAIKTLDQTAMLAGIDVPTLVIVGEDDPATPVAAARLIHGAVANSELVVIPGARHLCNIERGGAFNDALLGFLRHR